jgi:hypothetical protein
VRQDKRDRMKVRIKNKELLDYLKVDKPAFPKYVSPLINFANFYARGTVPEIVGQMTDLIQQFPGKSLTEWEEWYMEQNPDGIIRAIDLIMKKLEELKLVLSKIDGEIVEKWVKDLVIVKSYVGLKFQKAILMKAAEIKGCKFRMPTSEEESKGIDGHIGEVPVSIKPETYDAKSSLPEGIAVTIIYYKKLKDGIEVDFGGLV